MQHIKKPFAIFVTMNLVGIGIALFLESGLGADPIGILCEGISIHFHMMFGTASLLYNLFLILIALVFSRSSLGAGTVVYALFSGYFIDFYRMLMAPVNLGNCSLPIRFILYFVGLIFFTFGLSILISLSLGMNALDAILYKSEQITPFKYRTLRICYDICQTLLGFFWGGTFGAGTVLCAICTGYLVSFFVKINSERRLHHVYTSHSC